MSQPFDELVAGLSDPEVTPEDEQLAKLDALCRYYSVKIEICPANPVEALNNHAIEEILWRCQITTEAGSTIYAVAGESEGPFRAAQRAIDRHAFGIEIEIDQ